MEFRKMTLARGILAVISSCAEEAGIWAIWRYVLPAFGVELGMSWLIGAMVAWGIFSVWLFTFTTFALKKQKTTGNPSMLGARGRAASELAPKGMVRIKSELWKAVAAGENIGAGEDIIVVGEDRLTLTVARPGATR